MKLIRTIHHISCHKDMKWKCQINTNKMNIRIYNYSVIYNDNSKPPKEKAKNTTSMVSLLSVDEIRDEINPCGQDLVFIVFSMKKGK